MSRRQFKINPKWSLPSIVVGIALILAYQILQEFAFPVVVHEQANIKLKACFTPNHNCQDQVIKAINRAQDEILVLCYHLTSPAIGNALKQAKSKGVNVKIIADRTQRESASSQIHTLAKQGIPIWIDDSVTIAHNKVILIDQQTTLTGSYNFSEAAEHRNSENILFIDSPELTKQYKRYWEERKENSRRFFQTL